ncbi:Exodeoxyribonuclease VII large subunit [Fibrobacter sp. UWH9]|uniref:exodeoxyribonuclease VII large subunit n=1 Tax=unclassified Fibrobacter TaxID=2634177 RepID=UPI00090F8ED8|nr:MULTISPECIES: exodeoxyribonuclease VII large subunit [unclassified Fibrobacter]MCQ2099967.1 exodeoxyribonuclease VII large subunit [Fibrobacter sp.]OWV07192.1 exodeoxyribonuclease VII large subunit [Fibrobacter sp. UWH3]SHH66923.1 Exodeoxyribonuclease VII large subunit [Fibrobacter sp. UWH9]SHK78209.1 Exodeoxyribonuclease VII large subunit [Fibrobacter sp. UWH6]SHK82489.1 Exodeoxyribonuclease VII large subunit [Fibrobacter sp. UWH5]
MAQEIKSFTVTQYLTSLKKRVEETPSVWVRGVITRMTVKPNIVYISIADFVEGSVKPVAALDLTCFASRFAYILAKIQSFEQPFELREELKVSLQIKADLYIPTGRLQAQILDIDPVYTVGELALTKSAILKRLAVEGLLEKNKSLDLAEMPMRIGLITGEKTAAFKDFTSKLSDSPFAFKVMTVYAKMQGEETEKSVLAALEKLAREPSLDVVCIVRGGGSKTDLNYFDSEALCRAVANYHIPVFTGIGHEIDKSLLDEVAYQSCITPTDTAKRIIDRVNDGWNKMLVAAQNVAIGAKDAILRENQTLANAGARLQQKVTAKIQNEKTKLAVCGSNLKRDLNYIIRDESARLDRNTEGLKQGSRKILDLAKSKFTLSEVRVKAADPATTLAKGYSLTLDAAGKFIRNASQLKAGDKMTTRLRDGEVTSVVQ